MSSSLLRERFQLLTFLPFAIAASTVACGGSERHGSEDIIVDVNDNINEPTVWEKGKLYTVRRPIAIESILTIQPGTIVKFDHGGLLQMSLGASLIAKGTADLQIVFTSIKDDEHGGDTNNDGGDSIPKSGDWAGIYMGNTVTAVLNDCIFLYGGGGDIGTPSVLGLGRNENIAVTNSVFAHNTGGTPTDPRGALDARFAGSGTAITDDIFFDNDVPLTISGSINIDNSNVFHSPSDGSSKMKNRYQGIFYSLDPVRGFVHWANSDAPFVIPANVDMRVLAGNVLAIGTPGISTGQVLKFGSGTRLSVANDDVWQLNGVIILTSIRDDTGGDSNGDGPSLAAVGDWDGIFNIQTNQYETFKGVRWAAHP
jgi:hypothetical protein